MESASPASADMTMFSIVFCLLVLSRTIFSSNSWPAVMFLSYSYWLTIILGVMGSSFFFPLSDAPPPAPSPVPASPPS